MRDEVYAWVAWMLPKRLVYWCGVRLLNAATSEPYGIQVGDVRMVDALEGWDD